MSRFPSGLSNRVQWQEPGKRACPYCIQASCRPMTIQPPICSAPQTFFVESMRKSSQAGYCTYWTTEIKMMQDTAETEVWLPRHSASKLTRVFSSHSRPASPAPKNSPQRLGQGCPSRGAGRGPVHNNVVSRLPARCQ